MPRQSETVYHVARNDSFSGPTTVMLAFASWDDEKGELIWVMSPNDAAMFSRQGALKLAAKLGGIAIMHSWGSAWHSDRDNDRYRIVRK